MHKTKTIPQTLASLGYRFWFSIVRSEIHCLASNIFSVFLFASILLEIKFIHAQNIIIHGNAHPVYLTHSDKVARLYSYSDFITYQEILQDKDSLDSKGRFTLKFYTNKTEPVLIKIKNAVAKLYVEPPKTGVREYIIKMYPPDSILTNINDIDLHASISILTNDTTELNTLIFEFNKIYNKYLDDAMMKFLNRPVLFKKLDSILIESKKTFQHIHNSYFQNYLDYTIANINVNSTRDKNTIANIFLLKKSIQYDNYEYMEFFNSFFKDYLIADITQQVDKTIYYVINHATSIQQLLDYIKNDKILNTNDTLKELVMIQNLYHFYFNEKFNPYSIQVLLEQLLATTQNSYHQKILHNIIQELNKLKQGTVAPDFTAVTKDSTIFQLYSIDKQYIYLNFFSVRSPSSLRELQEIEFLYKKFGHKMKFVSVCVDEDFNEFKSFVKKHPQYKWILLWNAQPSNDWSAKVKYNVKAVPLFFFIDTDKLLALSPAPAPSDGIYYRLESLFKRKKGIKRIGEP